VIQEELEGKRQSMTCATVDVASVKEGLNAKATNAVRAAVSMNHEMESE
jgi:hypothetical protein